SSELEAKTNESPRKSVPAAADGSDLPPVASRPRHPGVEFLHVRDAHARSVPHHLFALACLHGEVAQDCELGQARSVVEGHCCLGLTRAYGVEEIGEDIPGSWQGLRRRGSFIHL